MKYVWLVLIFYVIIIASLAWSYNSFLQEYIELCNIPIWPLDISDDIYQQSIILPPHFDVVNFVTHHGFPIFIACYLLFVMERTLKRLTCLTKELIIKIELALQYLTKGND